MQCFKPFQVVNQGRIMEVPCGHCLGCRVAYSREWASRLLTELPYWDSASFVTLTYDEDTLPIYATLFKEDLVLFFKKLRKKLSADKRKCKYYASGEYGDKKNRPHYHSVIFGVSPSEKDLIELCWNMGRVEMGTVTYDSCRYVAQYVDKKYWGLKSFEEYFKTSRLPPFQICSQGFGLQFLNDNIEQLKNDLEYVVGGQKQSLPRYYIKKLKKKDSETENFVKELLFKKRIKNEKEVSDNIVKKGFKTIKHYHDQIKKAREQRETTLEGKIKLRRGNGKL